MRPHPIQIGVVLLFAFACCTLDLSTRRVPNVLTAPTLLAGLLLSYSIWGIQGLLESFMGVGVALVVLIGPFALGGIGGGDVKMMAATGAFLGPTLILYALLAGFLIGGVAMVVHLLWLRRLREKLVATYNMFVTAMVTRSLEPLRMAPGETEIVALPYSVPLALGTLVVMFATRFADGLR